MAFNFPGVRIPDSIPRSLALDRFCARQIVEKNIVKKIMDRIFDLREMVKVFLIFLDYMNVLMLWPRH